MSKQSIIRGQVQQFFSKILLGIVSVYFCVFVQNINTVDHSIRNKLLCNNVLKRLSYDPELDMRLKICFLLFHYLSKLNYYNIMILLFIKKYQMEQFSPSLSHSLHIYIYIYIYTYTSCIDLACQQHKSTP